MSELSVAAETELSYLKSIDGGLNVLPPEIVHQIIANGKERFGHMLDRVGAPEIKNCVKSLEIFAERKPGVHFLPKEKNDDLNKAGVFVPIPGTNLQTLLSVAEFRAAVAQ